MDRMEKQIPFIAASPLVDSILPSSSGTKSCLGESLRLSGSPVQNSPCGVSPKTFALVAQSVYFLDRVITHINTTYEDLDKKSKVITQLDTTIRAFTMNLLEGKGNDRTGHCWPHATCLRQVSQSGKYAVDNRSSALLLLHRDALEVKDGTYNPEDSCRAILALRSVIRITLDGIESGAYASPTAIELVPIWGLHCLSLAARSLIEFGDSSDKKQWEDDIECLHQTLTWFRPKWGIAGTYAVIIVNI